MMAVLGDPAADSLVVGLLPGQRNQGSKACLFGSDEGLSSGGEPLLSLLPKLRSHAQSDSWYIWFKSGFPQMSVLLAFGAGSPLSWGLSCVLEDVWQRRHKITRRQEMICWKFGGRW